MQYEYDLLTFIGRMGPPHIGHIETIRTALESAERVLILLGSSGEPRTPKNPFTFDERRTLLRLALNDSDMWERIVVEPLYDCTYNNDAWKIQVQKTVERTLDVDYVPKIGLIGHSKDESSWYLKAFPQWKAVEMPLVTFPDHPEFAEMLSATQIRDSYFENGTVSDILNPRVQMWLEGFKLSPDYLYVQHEFNFIKSFKESWANSPYPPTFNTTDAVVTQSGHVLLIQRGGYPQKGTWALPGGYLDQNETMLNGMIRELVEETKIKVPAKILEKNVIARRTFDDPKRSARGRVITEAFHIRLDDTLALPRVKGSDDAAKAKWVPISEVLHMRDQFFEDHFHIIRVMLGL